MGMIVVTYLTVTAASTAPGFDLAFVTSGMLPPDGVLEETV